MSSNPFSRRYGPWALVTGASAGIGEQFARLLAGRGLNLILSARRQTRLQAVAAELREQHGAEIEIVAADLSIPGDHVRLAEACAQRELGLAVLNAGFGFKGLFWEQGRDELISMINVNCSSVAVLAHELAPAMIERGRGGILITGSIEGIVAFPYSSAYAASKAFLHSLGTGLWRELKPFGVDVLVLAPGSTDTDAPLKQGISRDQLIGLMQPAQVAGQALYQLPRGPVFVPAWSNRLMMGLLAALPRRLAAAAAGASMKQAMRNSGHPVKDRPA